MALRLRFSRRARPSRRLARAGFSLIEMSISMVILLAMMSAALTLYRGQTRIVSQQARRLDALTNAQYATGSIERELRIAGVGVVPGQPVLVAATATSIVFNTNLVTRDSNDITAVYLNLDAEPAVAGVFSASNALLLPGQTTDLYPDSTYRDRSGTTSRAETIAFWIRPDSSATDPLEHVLYRRVNNAVPEMVAKGLIVSVADTVFQYFKADTLDRLTPITNATLPLTHVAASHLAASDTGRFSLIDSIRVVKVRFKSVTRAGPGATKSVRRAEATVRILNAGMAGAATCGSTPLGAGSVTATVSGPVGSQVVTLTWPQSIDEQGGERDVMRYAIYRRAPAGSSTAWDEPITSVPAGLSSYSFIDDTMIRGRSWEYGVAAQDCTPANSAIAKSASVFVQ